MKTFRKWLCEATETGGDPYARKYPSRRLTDFYEFLMDEVRDKGTRITVPVPDDITPQEAEWIVDKLCREDEGLKTYGIYRYMPRTHSVYMGDPWDL
jgi:hypothetical protein